MPQEKIRFTLQHRSTIQVENYILGTPTQPLPVMPWPAIKGLEATMSDT